MRIIIGYSMSQAQVYDLKATEIDARLGAGWIPVEDVVGFGYGRR